MELIKFLCLFLEIVSRCAVTHEGRIDIECSLVRELAK